MYQDALRRRADLAGIDEAAGCGRLRRAIEVGVIEDDDRAVAAEFHQLRLAGGALADQLSGRRTAGEADRVGAGIGDDLVADDGARAGHEVEDARRQVRLLDCAHQRDRHQRGRWGGRPDDGIAGGEPRRDVLDRYVHREIPWRHHGIDAARAIEGHHPLAGVLRRDRVAFEILDQVGGEVEAVDRLADLEIGLGVWFALFERQQGGKLGAPRGNGIGYAAHSGSALPDRDLAPAGLRLPRRGDCILRRPPGAPDHRTDFRPSIGECTALTSPAPSFTQFPPMKLELLPSVIKLVRFPVKTVASDLDWFI